MKQFILFLIVFLVYSCTFEEYPIDYILAEKNFIPEGIAYDNSSGKVYVGSTYLRKIVQLDKNGRAKDFVFQEQDDCWSMLGMEIDEDNRRLWVNTAHINEVMPLINPEEDKDWMTNVSVYDLDNGSLLKKFPLTKEFVALNDLCIDSEKNIYTTESVESKIYKLHYDSDSIEHFISLDSFAFANGIDILESKNLMFVTTIKGLVRIDLESMSFKLVKSPDSIELKGLDGIAFYKDRLIGNHSDKIISLTLNEPFDHVISAEILDSGLEYDGSTTGEIAGDEFVFIVNSQIQSAVDYKLRTLFPLDSLKHSIIRRIKLN